MGSYNLFIQRKFKEVAKLIPECSKILDIGCNDSGIINFLQNPIYFGVDGDKEIVHNLQKRKLNVKLVDLNKQNLPFEEEKFDFVLLLDILEHVVDPKKLIYDSKKRLNEFGKLIITLPNDYHILNKIRFVFNKHLTDDPFASYGHLHYFPIKSGEIFLKNQQLTIFKKIIIPPIRPVFIPKIIKDFLANLFPQTFARDVLYVCSI